MKSLPKIAHRVAAALKECSRICIVGHVRPDGDCIGSQLALALALRGNGKTVVCWNDDPVPAKYRFLDPDGLIQAPRGGWAFECVVTIDAGSPDRLGSAVEHIGERKLLINIDHHETNTRFGDINWVSAHAAATGELIFKLLKAGHWPITPAIANCLFTAISTDTGSFRYPTTRPGTYHIAGELLARGAKLDLICEEVYQSYPLSRVKLLKHLYSHFRLVCRNQIAYVWLKQSDFKRAGADRADAEGIIDHLSAIDPVVVACVFEETDDGAIHVSFRSKSDRVSVNQVAEQFGGGGHPAAAGATLHTSPASAQRRVLGAVKLALAKAGFNITEK